MTARLPTVNGDDDQWGTILNTFLSVSLNSDGTLSTAAVNSAVSAASNGQAGVVQLAGDLGGTSASPTVTSVHLGSPLGTSYGGTGNTSGKGLVDVALNGAVQGTRSKINFINGTNVTINTADDPTNGKVDVTITSSGGGGGGGLSDPTTTKGDLLVRNSSAVTREPVGSNGQVLNADSTQATGVAWITPVKTVNSNAPDGSGNVTVSAIPLTTVTTKGDLVVGTGSGAVTRLASGTTANTYLKTDGAGNLSWATAGSGGGGSSFSAVTRTFSQGNYNASNYDFVLCNASGGLFYVYLPTAANGAWVRVKKTDSSTNAILVEGLNSTTIDGSNSFSCNNQYESQDFMSDGTEWYLI